MKLAFSAIIVVFLTPILFLNSHALYYDTFSISGTPFAMKINEKTNKIYVLSSDKLTEIDGTSLKTKKIELKSRADSFAINLEKNLIYVASGDSSSIITIDAKSLEVNNSTNLNLSGFDNYQISSLNYDPETNHLFSYLFSWNDGQNLSKTPSYKRIITISENGIVNEFDISEANKLFPFESSNSVIEGNLRFIAQRNGTFVVFDESTRGQPRTYDLTQQVDYDKSFVPTSFDKMPNEDVFFILLDKSYTDKQFSPLKIEGKLIIFDLQYNKIKQIPTGSGPRAMVFNPNTQQILVLNSESSSISVFDLESFDMILSAFSYRFEIGLVIFVLSLGIFVTVSRLQKVSSRMRWYGFLSICGIYFPILFENIFFVGRAIFWLRISPTIGIPIWGPIIYIPLIFSLTTIILVLIRNENLRKSLSRIFYDGPKGTLEKGIYQEKHSTSDLIGFVITAIIVVFALSYVISTIPASAAVSIIPGSSFLEYFTSSPTDVSKSVEITASQYVALGPYSYVIIPVAAVLWIFAIRQIQIFEKDRVPDDKKFRGSRGLLIFLYLSLLLLVVTFMMGTNPYDGNSLVDPESNLKIIVNSLVKSLYIGIPASVLLYVVEKSLSNRIQVITDKSKK